MTISRISLLVSIALILIYAILGGVAVKVLQLELAERKNSDLILLSYQQADHLRQTSDDLTRMARTYVVTGDPVYKEHYYQILDIRNGKAPRPTTYSSTFWYTNIDPDTQQLTGVKRGKPLAWVEIMNQIGLSDDERDQLRLAQGRSDRLVKIEEQAFAAMEGLFDDGTGSFVVHGVPDKDFATRILFDKAYQHAKKEIMEPIQRFIALVGQSAISKTKSIHDEMIGYIVLGIVLVVFSMIFGVFLFVYTRKMIVSPLTTLEATARAISSGYHSERANIDTSNELHSLADSINAMAASMQSQIEQFKHLSRTDALTGLNNRRRFDEVVGHEMERVQRYGTKVSLLMIDIDHFKIVNDSYGHQRGDQVLHKIGQLLLDNVRSLDIPCRYGGEELAIIMPEADATEASVVAERIREAIGNNDFSERGDGPRTVTVSIGVAGCPSKGCSVQAFVSAADAALYEAKSGGRNKVCISSAPESPSVQ